MMAYVREAYTKKQQQRDMLVARIMSPDVRKEINDINTELLMVGKYLLFVKQHRVILSLFSHSEFIELMFVADIVVKRRNDVWMITKNRCSFIETEFFNINDAISNICLCEKIPEVG